MTMQGYLASVADSDLFGTLAIICVVVAVSGFFESVRKKKLHKIMTFLCLMAIPVIHAIGTYYLNLPPA